MNVSIGIDIGGTKCAFSVGSCSADAVEIGHIRLAPTGPVGYNKAGSAEGFCSVPC